MQAGRDASLCPHHQSLRCVSTLNCLGPEWSTHSTLGTLFFPYKWWRCCSGRAGGGRAVAATRPPARRTGFRCRSNGVRVGSVQRTRASAHVQARRHKRDVGRRRRRLRRATAELAAATLRRAWCCGGGGCVAGRWGVHTGRQAAAGPSWAGAWCLSDAFDFSAPDQQL